MMMYAVLSRLYEENGDLLELDALFQKNLIHPVFVPLLDRGEMQSFLNKLLKLDRVPYAILNAMNFVGQIAMYSMGQDLEDMLHEENPIHQEIKQYVLELIAENT